MSRLIATTLPKEQRPYCRFFTIGQDEEGDNKVATIALLPTGVSSLLMSLRRKAWESDEGTGGVKAKGLLPMDKLEIGQRLERLKMEMGR